MIFGCGIDSIEIERIKKAIERSHKFIERVFTYDEILQKICIRHYAKRFAAKEAVLKAMGTGLRDGLKWHDIFIFSDHMKKPCVSLSDNALYVMKKNSIIDFVEYKVHLSLSDNNLYAQAVAIIEI
jgi:holo-[acyl-carrier protein] synthase